MSRSLLILTLVCLTLTLSSAKAIGANKTKADRWFEVEVILFTRDIPHDAIRETFKQQISPITFRRTRDLLSTYHYPDIRLVFEAAGNCSVEEKILQPSAPMPTAAQLEQLFAPVSIDEFGQSVKPLPQIDVAALYNDAFVPPDLTLWPEPQQLDCNGLPQSFSWQQPLAFLTADKHKDRSFSYHYDMYPRVINPGEMRHDPYVHLMSPRNFKLREIYRTLRRQPDMRPILHTAWRQPGRSPGRSRATRLFAGIDYSEKYDFQGNLKPDEIIGQNADLESKASINDVQDNPGSVVDNIENILSQLDQGAQIDFKNHKIKAVEDSTQQDLPEQVIEIDGLFRIYLDRFNYLHIDAEFNLRREVAVENPTQPNLITPLLDGALELPEQEPTPTRLANFHFKQTRRVVTKQLHYFDHPYMGMIVQIRRYGW